MTRFLSTFVVLLLTVMISSCRDNLPPASIGESAWNEFDNAESNNSFVLHGAGFQGTVFNMERGSLGAFYESATGSVKLIQSNIIFQPAHEPISTFVLLVFPNTRGSWPWANLHETPKDSASVWSVMSIEGQEYVSVEGETKVIFAKDVSNHITGTWSGTLATGFGDTVRIDRGRFHIPLEEL